MHLGILCNQSFLELHGSLNGGRRSEATFGTLLTELSHFTDEVKALQYFYFSTVVAWARVVRNSAVFR